jgi:hypothetical protein
MSVSPLWLVPARSSFLIRGLVLGFFGNSTSNTSKYNLIILLWFTSLLYSLPVEGRVIICCLSVVLGLGYS